MPTHLRRLHPLVAAAALTAPAVLGGCAVVDGGERPTLAPEAATTTTIPARTELLDPGSEPRRAVRLGLTAGAETTVVVRTDLDVTQGADGGTTTTTAAPVAGQHLDAPAIVQTVTFTVDRVQDDEADVSFRIDDVAVDGSGTDLTEAELLTLTVDVRALVGLTGSGRLTDRGELRSVAYDPPQGLAPEAATALERFEGDVDGLGVPLPAEAIGAGARWRSTGVTVVNGIRVEQTTTYEVTSLDADGLGYRFDLTQTAGQQPLDPDALPGGTRATLVSAELTGSGQGSLASGALVASAEATTSGRQVVELRTQDGSPQRVGQDVSLSLSVLPAP